LAKEASDAAGIHVLAEAVGVLVREAEGDLSRGFARGETSALVRRLGELRFYRRFLDEVSAIEDQRSA
jgi:hypothetical protein